MDHQKYAELEVWFSRTDQNRCRVFLSFSLPDNMQKAPEKASYDIPFNPDEIAQDNDPVAYGLALSDSLFGASALSVRDSFNDARRLAADHNVPLRLRLTFDWDAAKLHALRWETLCDPQDPKSFLAMREKILISRYLPIWDDLRREDLLPSSNLKALVVIANPKTGTGSHWVLPAVDVAGELERAQRALEGVATITALFRPDQTGPAAAGLPTLQNLVRYLSDESPDILYLACHGRIINDQPSIWLEDDQGGADLISAMDERGPGGPEMTLYQVLNVPARRPRLAVLASCQSAGASDVWSSSDRGRLSALGPLLLKAGVSAVIAMQQDVTMESVARFTPAFFRELRRDGQIDRALAVARAELDSLGRPDWWVPVLYMRLESGQLKMGQDAISARVFFRVPDVRDLAPRPGLLAQAKAPLLDPNRLPPRMVALRGPGGFGKTTLASALCHDPEVGQAFPDGILWTSLAETPKTDQQLIDELSRLFTALGGTPQSFGSKDDAADALAAQMDGKRCLLVLDNVWNLDDLEPFLQGGDQCARLITTRKDPIALAKGAVRVPVDEMEPNEAAALLTLRLEPQPADMAPYRDLAVRLGRMPLLLDLAGAWLYSDQQNAIPPAQSLADLNERLDVQGIVAIHQQNEAERDSALTATLATSLKHLAVDEKERFAQLGIFARDIDIPLSAVEVLWGLSRIDTRDLYRKLNNLSLFRLNSESGTIRLHSVVSDYLARQLTDPVALHLKLVDGWGDPYHLPTPYAWRWIAYHLAEAARTGTSPDARHAATKRLVDLLVDPHFWKAHIEALRDPASLHDDLQLALSRALADNEKGGLPLMVKAARGLVTFRLEKLGHARVFDRASSGDVDGAMRQLALFSTEREWRQAASLIVAWLAGPQSNQAQALFQRVSAQIPQRGPLQDLANRVSTVLNKQPWPASTLPTGVTEDKVEALMARMAGHKDKTSGLPMDGPREAMEVLQPSASSYEASLDMTADANEFLVGYVAEHRGEPLTYVDDYLAILAANSYVRYRNKFLWPLLSVVIRHLDPAWAQRYAARVAEAALSPNKLHFQEAVPITLLGLLARANAPDARAALEHYRQEVEGAAATFEPENSRGDTWGSYMRRLAALAQAHHLLGESGLVSQSLGLAQSVHYGFAGFASPARLTLAETARTCGGSPPQAEAWLDAAEASAHNIQEAGFCAQTTARVNALRQRWWGAAWDGAHLGDTVKTLCEHPEDPQFASLHLVDETEKQYPQRQPRDPHADGEFRRMTGVRTLGELAVLFDQPVEECLRLNPQWAGASYLPPGAWVQMPDPELAPLLAARLAAELLVTPLATPQEAVSLIQALVPVATPNPTALDTVLSRLLVAAAPDMTPDTLDALAAQFRDGDVLQHLIELLKKDLPMGYMSEGLLIT